MEESAALISSNSNEELCPIVSSDALETAISKPGGDAAESHRDSQESTEDSEQNSSTVTLDRFGALGCNPQTLFIL